MIRKPRVFYLVAEGYPSHDASSVGVYDDPPETIPRDFDGELLLPPGWRTTLCAHDTEGALGFTLRPGDCVRVTVEPGPKLRRVNA